LWLIKSKSKRHGHETHLRIRQISTSSSYIRCDKLSEERSLSDAISQLDMIENS